MTENIGVIKHSSGEYLLKMYYSTVEAGHRGLREHRHTAFEIGFIRSGSGNYAVGKKNYDITDNDLYFYSTNEPHCITNIDSADGMRILNIQFEPRFIWAGRNEEFDSRFLRIFLNRKENFENRFDRNDPAGDEIRSLLLKIEEEFLSKRPEHELMIKIYLLTILTIANRSYGCADTSADTLSLHKKQLSGIERAMDYINANYCADISLEEISSCANMSKNYFSTLFKNLNGMSPWEYITVKRIELACVLLRNGDKTMMEIACECGFNNSANFNRAFKKVTGISPKIYRNGN